MAPTGLVISKLAIQTTASDEILKGVLCLKVSLPRVTDTSKAIRWALFPSTPPTLTSPPSIHALPLAGPSSRAARIAQSLLNLSNSSAYPSTSPIRDVIPHLDVSSTNGQVYIVLDGSSGKRRHSSSGSSSGSSMPRKGDRKDYLVVMEIQERVEKHKDASSASISLPKCLDNVIRFQIASPDGDGEVSIMTEPKLLPLPPGAFGSSASSSNAHPRGSNGLGTEDDGWEDGEDLDEDEAGILAADSGGEGSGEWLEGRFQSTDVLRLEWSLSPSESSIPRLQVMPVYDRARPSIHISYEAPLSHCDIIETVLPDGWGFSSLCITANGLRGWRCVDSPYVDCALSASSASPGTPDLSDSNGKWEGDPFDTIRASRGNPNARSRGSPQLSSSSSKASLLRQTIPEMKVEDFSFELNDDSILSDTTIAASVRKTPNAKGIPSPAGGDLLSVRSQRPVAGRTFELDFDPTTAGESGTLLIESVLAPLSKMTLVEPGVPVQMPRIRYGEAVECIIHCPQSTFGDGEPSDGMTCTEDTVAYFDWSNHNGHPLLSKPRASIVGDVQVKAGFRWGAHTLSLEIPVGQAGVVPFDIPGSGEDMRILKATSRGRALPRSSLPAPGSTRFFFRVVAPGKVEILMELTQSEAEGDGPLPRFDNAQVTVLRPTSTTAAPTPRRWGLLSWSTLTNLFILWLLLSMAQQVQRLRSEVAWVADEARDLRLYQELLRQAPTSPPPPPVIPDAALATPQPAHVTPEESGIEVRQSAGDMSTALGRVVFGRTGWDRFSSHPTVRTLSKGLGWLWHTVVWLVIPPS